MTSTARARALAALMAVVAAAGIVAGEVLSAGWPLPITEWLFGAAMLLPAVGWLIAVRRSDNVYGWLLLASAWLPGPRRPRGGSPGEERRR